MANLHFITPQLATGGDLPVDNEAALRELAEWVELGITHVIDNRGEAEDADFLADYAPQISYLHNGVDDAGQLMPDQWFDDGLAFAEAALQEPNAKVLVHCHMGINRGPSLAFAILLAQGWNPVEALAAIRSVRAIAGIIYSEDALAWHLRRTGVSGVAAAEAVQQLRRWHRDNHIDLIQIIATERERELQAS